MMFFLLAFVALVAAFSITNTLLTLTVQKTHEIGLMKALGFGSGGIMGIFLWMGLVQGFIGTGCGIGLVGRNLEFLSLNAQPSNNKIGGHQVQQPLDIQPPQIRKLLIKRLFLRLLCRSLRRYIYSRVEPQQLLNLLPYYLRLVQ